MALEWQDLQHLGLPEFLGSVAFFCGMRNTRRRCLLKMNVCSRISDQDETLASLLCRRLQDIFVAKI